MPEHKVCLIDEEVKDLGFGARVTERSALRLLNHDGSFNVQRRGFSFLRSLSLYHSLLAMPWWQLHLTILASFAAVNAMFGAAFLLCGPEALGGLASASLEGRLLEAFFFSVQTFTTVGYGHISPVSPAANFLATADAFVGLLGFALATGLLFARFSRPTSRVVFSRNAIIAPYQNRAAFEFRLANERSNQLIELEVRLLHTRMETVNGARLRRFHGLRLERSKVAFLPLHLTVVHAIDELSPLHGFTAEMLEQADAEFLVLVTAIDETYSANVHARSSYKCDEIVWGARFSNMLHYPPQGMINVDLRRIHDIEPADLIAASI